MTPGARANMSMDILRALEVSARPADRLIDQWFRDRRFAGSGDRRYISELVYQILRRRAELVWLIDGLDGADDIDADTLRQTLDNIKDKLGNAAVVLASVTAEGKVRLAAGVSKDATSRIRAGDLVNHVAHQVGGKGGGGRPDMAQAGGPNGADAAEALKAIESALS